MASFSVNKVVPSTFLPSTKRSSWRRDKVAASIIRCQQQPPSAVSAAAETASTAVKPVVDPARLVPRVEERDGYWVLKEEFRAGINPPEKIKIEKDPMKLFIEDGIKELAQMSMEEIDQNKHAKDDIDVRLKWLGLFHRRKHHCKSSSTTAG